MKVIFVENRFKTYFWKKCKDKLLDIDFSLDIRWIVQNHSFVVDKDSFVIPYPKKKDLFSLSNNFFDELKKKDRLVYIYGGSSKHYSYYYEVIENYLKIEIPDFVIGESTLFHELIIIDVCKKLGIPYLHPTPCRYPAGKFSIFLYDSLIAFNSHESNAVKEDFEIISKIVDRKVAPSYMSKPKGAILFRSNIYKIYNTIMSLKSWSFGEKYNTPNPLIKYKFNCRLARNIKKLNSLSEKCFISDEHYRNGILFPLQMQPEANIDVWGAPYNDQLDNLVRLTDVLVGDEKVIVKPNPKSKYELSDKLLAYIESDDRIVCVKNDVLMDEIFNKVNRVYTVTGTVGIESILSGKQLITEIGTFYDGYPNVATIEGGKIVERPVKYPKERLIAHARHNSCFGEVSDAVYSSTCMSDTNTLKVASQLLYKLKGES